MGRGEGDIGTEQTRASHHEAGIPQTTNPDAGRLPRHNGALLQLLTSCHLQEEKRNTDQEHHEDVDDEKDTCER